MENIYFYEDRFVQKGRKEKTCACCEEDIPKGKPSYTLTYVDYGEFRNLSVCPDCYEEYGKDGDAVVENYFNKGNEK